MQHTHTHVKSPKQKNKYETTSRKIQHCACLLAWFASFANRSVQFHAKKIKKNNQKCAYIYAPNIDTFIQANAYMCGGLITMIQIFR